MFSHHDWELARNGDTDKRNEILVCYQYLVKRCADKISSGLPKHVDKDDIIQCGQFGLLDAIVKFDPARGFKFETYATKRIRGSMIDELRAQDWVPRSVRAGEKSIDNAIEQLTHKLGRDPTPDELEDLVGISTDEISLIRGASESGRMQNLFAPIVGDNGMEEGTVADMVISDDRDTGYLFDTCDRERILVAIDALADRERVTLAMHYYLGYTLAEIGELFEVTESRVCQIHTAALKDIRVGLHAAD
jgi:RNA polymerase sigma factor for flagellar operon FliA